MLRVKKSLAALVVAAAVAAPAPADEGPRLSWLSPEGGTMWSLPLAPVAGTRTVEGKLSAPAWHKKLPDIDVRLVGGGVLSLRQAPGSVLALTFWATWCDPCRRELPRLQALYEARRQAGLRVVAINVDEPLEVAIPFAEDLGLTMPIGLFDPAMRPSLFAKTVPSLVIADREGNIRGRWDGFEPRFEAEIDKLIEALLHEERPAPLDVAPVLEGAGRFSLEWFRETKSQIDDVAVTTDAAGAPAILVSRGVMMSLHVPDGSTAREWVADRSAGLVRLAPPKHDAEWNVATFRPGARQVVLLPKAGGDPRVSDLEAPVFDLAWLPQPYRAEGRVLAAGTLEGLALLDETGRVTARPDGFGAVAALGVAGASHEELVVLESAGRLSWVDPTFRIVRSAEAPRDPWRLVTDTSGAVGVASDEAVALVRGRFAPDGSAGLALATRSGRLLIVSVAEGRIVFEAEWPEIVALAAGDLDGDRVDELIVAVGKSFGVLRRTALTTSSAP